MVLNMNKEMGWRGLVVLSFCFIHAAVWAKDDKSYQCYVLGTDTLHYLVSVDAPSLGYAMSVARHVRLTSESTGPVGIRDVLECVELGKSFKNKQAQKLESKQRNDEDQR